MIKKLLSQSSYWIVNKDLTKELGIQSSLLLTHLIDCADMLDQPFFQQRERIMESLGFTRYTFDKSLKKLISTDILFVEKKGNPAKNYYTISESRILEILNYHPISRLENEPTSRLENEPTKKVINKIKTITSGMESVDDNPSVVPPSIPTHDEGGWERLLRIYPKNKMNGEIDAITKWNTLTQEDKQKVFRHLNVYIKNTEHQYIKQIGNYFNEEPWSKMKPKKNKYEGMTVINSQNNLTQDEFFNSFK